MSVTREKNKSTWMSQIRVKDWEGKVHHKKKRNLPTKKAALQYERDFLNQINNSLGMTFQDFIQIYLDDQAKRLKESTYQNKCCTINKKILPFFGKMPLNQIKPTDIRKWQNKMTSYRKKNGKPYSPTYLKNINNQITAIFNYAVKFYGLKENPCHKAGTMGKKNADEMLFWTKDEFAQFIETMKDRPVSYAIFMTFYYTGIREGELLGLFPEDIDLEKGTLSVNRTYHRQGGKDIFTSPKTEKSKRVVTIPNVLQECLREYMSQCYDLRPGDRLFPCSKSFLYRELAHGCKASGVKRIRIHDLRHSHASLLIEMGFPPLLIAERLGHEHVETTLETYGHLYPNKQSEVARQLDELKL